MTRKLFTHAAIHSPVDNGHPAAGERQGQLFCHPDGFLLVEDGIIRRVGDCRDLGGEPAGGKIDEVIECAGRCLIPGFVDPHTHMCFAARREAEFARRLTGTPYLEILREGGGILSSVAAVRAAGEDELLAATLGTVRAALRYGTTTVEIKSGYGLDTVTELKMLRVIDRVARATPQDVRATFLGAHAVPTEYRGRTDEFVTLLVEEMLPAVRAQGIASACDVFCEEGVFSLSQTRTILEAARDLGLTTKLHADEVHDLGGAGLAAELGAASADHLLAARNDTIDAMARAGVVAVLLPATAYSLRKPYARARFMVNRGVPVALATDCNPGSSFTESMEFVFGLAVMNMALSPAEALTGATLNGAYALGLADRVGSLEVGKQADLVLLDGETPAILAYHAGVSSVIAVYKQGEKVA